MERIESCIMVVDDDRNDLVLLEKAFGLCGVKEKILFMNNGDDALAYLQGEGEYADRSVSPYPSFVITDLKMPKIDGFAILECIQTDSTHGIVPKVVLSSSEDPDDIRTAYKLGASSYHVKPYRFDELCGLVKNIFQYWKTCRTPLIDCLGNQIPTDSRGKHGERYATLDQST